MGLLDKKTAIVTGASSGIGRKIAQRFAEEGAVVALADVRETPIEGGEPTLALITAAGGRAFYQKTDVTKSADLDRLVAETVRRYGRLDVMVNNAMVWCGTPLTETSEEEWARVMGVNLTGMFLGCKRAVQQMLTQEPVNEVRGRIVNITSQHGMIASPGDVSYGTSKSGGVYLTRQIAVDYAKDLIVCNAVAPGKIITGKTYDSNPNMLDMTRRRAPWPRLGRPEDVANAAVFLASDLATYITGVNLMVDGGWMAG